MSLRRLSITKPPTVFLINRPLTCVTSTAPKEKQPEQSQPSLHQHNQPKPFDQSFLNWVTSILSHKSLDSSKCKDILAHLTPHQFDSLLFAIRFNVNPKTVLNFFHFASNSCGYRFSVRSYCLLIRLLLFSKFVAPARLLLIQLIDWKLPVSFNDPKNRHLEIATAMSELNLGSELALSVQTFDLLIHVYCTQFKNLGFEGVVDVFRLLASKGMFPSLNTCNFLLSSLVKANELHTSYEVFDIICRGVSPDVYLFSTAINAFCKGGKVEDAMGLFLKMEQMGTSPNVVTYNNIINGLCKNGDIDEAFKLKEKMIKNGVNPSLITYSVLIN
ncbi:Pentatricopeptide repeat-containing protein, partial [Actinidia chinensis var. chinensis]